jgi:hypothetical protein
MKGKSGMNLERGSALDRDRHRRLKMTNNPAQELGTHAASLEWNDGENSQLTCLFLIRDVGRGYHKAKKHTHCRSIFLTGLSVNMNN